MTAADRREEVHRLTGIVNSHDLVKSYAEATGTPPLPYIAYRPQQSGRGYQCAAWQVHRPGFTTDDSANRYWRDNRLKTFNVLGRDEKAPQLDAAKKWVAKQYGVTEWATTGLARATAGDQFPAQVVAWFVSRLKDLRKLAVQP